MDKQKDFEEMLNSSLLAKLGLKDEILELIKKKCEVCNSIPIDCALQPHCGDRKLLKIQIEMGVPYEQLPKFCYEQQIQAIFRFMNGEACLIEPRDVKIFLNHFLEKLIGEKKVKFRNSDTLYSKLIVKLSEYDENFYAVRKEVNGKGKIIFILKDVIYLLDFDNQIAIINYDNSYVNDEEELEMILNLLTQRYKLNMEIDEELRGWWKLIFSFPKDFKIDENAFKEFKSKIKEYVRYVNFYKTYDNYKLKIDIKTPKSMNWEREKLSIKEIKTIFETIGKYFR
ncbi:MAG: hypothetical protein ACTSRP_16505 [Candidatus Helarchaeota archaeon]